jgi:PepSY-associated TM region
MKQIYRWHRRLSLIIALPVVLSASSGFLHPIMTNIRPAVATQGLAPRVIEGLALRVSLEAALDSNHIDSVSRVRIVAIDSNWFYQIQRWGDDVPVYLSAKNGHKLYQGDWLYAQWLARQFLEGVAGPAAAGPAVHGRAVSEGTMAARDATTAGAMAMIGAMAGSDADCCDEATSSILHARGSRVVGAVRLTDFDAEYNEVNRLMPVYRVAFDRPDGIRIYVETTQDRYALAVDNRRAAFNKVFEYIHTYQWLGFLGRGRPIAEFLLIGLAFVTTLLGITIFFSTSSKRVPGNGYVRARRNHRYTAIVISLFTLAFTFSGAYHALTKLHDEPRRQYVARFAAAGLRADVSALAAAVRDSGAIGSMGDSGAIGDSSAIGSISGLSLVNVGGESYWRVRLSDKGKMGRKDLMRDMQASAPALVYVRVSDGRVLPDGEQRYARWLATQFSGRPESDVVSTTLITKFDRDYNFTDKRLPVWRVGYAASHHERYYVETASGALAVRVNDLDLIEGYSFALLHKHEFLGGLGKSVKDFSTMFWAAAQVLVVVLGLVLYVKNRRRKN